MRILICVLFLSNCRDVFAGMGASPFLCLSIISEANVSQQEVVRGAESGELHLEAESDLQLQTLVSSLSGIFRSKGREVVEVEEKGSQFVRKTSSVMVNGSIWIPGKHFRVLLLGDDVKTQTYSMAMAMYLASASNFQKDVKKMLAAGRCFTGHAIKRGKHFSKKVRLWYESSDPSRLGSFCWCPASLTPRELLPECSLPADEIQCVIFGKQDKAFLYPVCVC